LLLGHREGIAKSDAAFLCDGHAGWRDDGGICEAVWEWYKKEGLWGILGRNTNPELGEGLVDWTIDLPAEGHRLKGTYESLKLTEGRRGQRWVSFRKPCIVYVWLAGCRSLSLSGVPIFVNLATVAGHPELIKAGAVFCRFGQCLTFVAWMEGSSKSYVDFLMLEQP
jgi:hypothetical protein